MIIVILKGGRVAYYEKVVFKMPRCFYLRNKSINKLIQSKVYQLVRNWERTNSGDNINA